MLSYIRNFEEKRKRKIKIIERNYLDANIVYHFRSELKRLEKIITERKIHIYIGTWNMNGKKQLNDLIHFMLPNGLQNIADIIVIGTQETCMYNTKEWESTVQNIIGSNYVLKTKKQFGRLRLILFLRQELILFSSIFEINTILSNKYTIFKTKGAISLAFTIFSTSFLLIMVHLCPHTKNTNQRILEVKKIIHSLKVPKKLYLNHKSEDSIENFDSVFFFGDLNFRLNNAREEVMNWISNTHFSRKTPITLKNDQLKILLDNKIILQHFIEAPITFPPTYKYNNGSQELDFSVDYRTPSYTDRILYKCNNIFLNTRDNEDKIYVKNREIKCIIYNSARSICSSDHKPVYGIYTVKIRTGINK